MGVEVPHFRDQAQPVRQRTRVEGASIPSGQDTMTRSVDQSMMTMMSSREGGRRAAVRSLMAHHPPPLKQQGGGRWWTTTSRSCPGGDT